MDNNQIVVMDPNVSVEYEVFGKVQVQRGNVAAVLGILNQTDGLGLEKVVVFGCAFPKYCKDMCEELGITGWVKNTKKGTITGKLQGKKSQVEQVIYWISNTGSPGCHIERCDLSNWQMLATPDYKNFSIRF